MADAPTETTNADLETAEEMIEPFIYYTDPRNDPVIGSYGCEKLPKKIAEALAKVRTEERGRCAAIVECNHPDALALIKSGETAWGLVMADAPKQTTVEALRERVAKAVYEHWAAETVHDFPWPPYNPDYWRESAQVAIDEMAKGAMGGPPPTLTTKSAVISEVDPSSQGWVPLGNRVWRRPDGTPYRFPPPPAREVIMLYRELRPGEVVHVQTLVKTYR